MFQNKVDIKSWQHLKFSRWNATCQFDKIFVCSYALHDCLLKKFLSWEDLIYSVLLYYAEEVAVKDRNLKWGQEHQGYKRLLAQDLQ